MDTGLKNALKTVQGTLAIAEKYQHACHVLTFDQETICPPESIEEQGEVTAFLEDKAYRLRKRQRFIAAAQTLYEGREQLDERDRILAESLHREYLRTKNVTPAINHHFSLVYNRAFVAWLKAKKNDDFAMFAPALQEVLAAEKKKIALMEEALPDPYDNLLGIYERGMTVKTLDAAFGACKERLIPLLKEIVRSKKVIRTEFLSRPVTDDQQRRMAQALLEIMGFDFSRGAFSTTEHPFTDSMGRNDTRVTTHYHPTQFLSSVYSVIHEGGHALFEQMYPREDYDHHINDQMTMGQHESVSRFYENRIGRSREFIDLIWPVARGIFPDVLKDVTPQELYRAVNVVSPSLIRTEADEFTYTFHIIIRYEIERALLSGNLCVGELPNVWSDLYDRYLGVRPDRAADGVLQDVHWTGGFGYFPAYALGNMYNAMYTRRMSEEFSLEDAVGRGDFSRINGWMREHVFQKANRLDAAQWIREITGRGMTPQDFLDYLEKKYCELYGL